MPQRPKPVCVGMAGYRQTTLASPPPNWRHLSPVDMCSPDVQRVARVLQSLQSALWCRHGSSKCNRRHTNELAPITRAGFLCLHPCPMIPGPPWWPRNPVGGMVPRYAVCASNAVQNACSKRRLVRGRHLSGSGEGVHEDQLWCAEEVP